MLLSRFTGGDLFNGFTSTDGLSYKPDARNKESFEKSDSAKFPMVDNTEIKPHKEKKKVRFSMRRPERYISENGKIIEGFGHIDKRPEWDKYK